MLFLAADDLNEKRHLQCFCVCQASVLYNTVYPRVNVVKLVKKLLICTLNFVRLKSVTVMFFLTTETISSLKFVLCLKKKLYSCFAITTMNKFQQISCLFVTHNDKERIFFPLVLTVCNM